MFRSESGDGSRSKRDFVRKTRFGLEELKKYFDKAPPGWSEEMTTPPKRFYLSDIGSLAITEVNKEAIEFLIDNLDHDDSHVRLTAAAFLGDLSPLHPYKWEAFRALNDLTQREKDDKVRDMALRSRTVLKKKLGGIRSPRRKVAFC